MIELINNYGYIGIMMLIFIENVFPPIPSEVVLVFGGFLTTQVSMSAPLVILFSTIGSVMGAAVLYAVGRLLSRERIKKLLSGRLGQTIRLKPEDVTKAEHWFKKYEYKAVLVCRCIPLVRSLISVPAGIARMRLTPFFLLTVAGTAVWNTILVYAGRFAGNAWEQSLKYIGWYSSLAIVLVLLVAAYIFIKYLDRRFLSVNNDENKDENGKDI